MFDKNLPTKADTNGIKTAHCTKAKKIRNLELKLKMN